MIKKVENNKNSHLHEVKLKIKTRVKKLISDKKTGWAIFFLVLGLVSIIFQVASFQFNLDESRTIVTILLVSIGICGLIGFFLLAFLKGYQFNWNTLNTALIIIMVCLTCYSLYNAYVAWDHHLQIEYFGKANQCSDDPRYNQCDDVEGTAFCEFLGVHVSIWGWLNHSILLGFFISFLLFRKEIWKRLIIIPTVILIWDTIYSIFLLNILFFYLERNCINCFILHTTHFCMLLTILILIRGKIIKYFKFFFERELISFKPIMTTVIAIVIFGVSILFFVLLTNNITSSYASEKNQIDKENKNLISKHLEDPCELKRIIDPLHKIKEQYRCAKKFEFNKNNAPSKGENLIGIEFVLFEDFGCDACKELSFNLEKLLKEYDNKFKIYIKFYPWDTQCNPYIKRTLHNDVCLAAYAAMKMHDKGLFYPYYDLVFANQDNISLDSLTEFANQFGVDTNKFEDQIKSKKYIDIINEHVDEAENCGSIKNTKVVSGTPTIFVNGAWIDNRDELDYDTLKYIIEELKQ